MALLLVASALEPMTDQWAVGYVLDASRPARRRLNLHHLRCGMEMQKLRVERVLSIPETAVIAGLRHVVC
jgi:hypothetical protein